MANDNDRDRNSNGSSRDDSSSRQASEGGSQGGSKGGSQGASKGARTDRGNQGDEGIGSSATRNAPGASADEMGGTQDAGGSSGSTPTSDR